MTWSGIRVGLLVWMFLVSPVLAQDMAALTGTWTNPEFRFSLSLMPDGRYEFDQAGTVSVGRYQYLNRILALFDLRTMGVAQFMVVATEESSLTLQDTNGVVVTFYRPGSEPVEARQPEGGGEDTSEVLASKDGFNLTRAGVGIGVGLVQFIIGGPILPAEVEEMERQSVVEFNQDPAWFTGQLTSLEQALRRLQGLTDTVQIGLGRQQLFSELHLATRAIPEADRPLLVRILERYVRVLAVDEANRLVLTDRDVDGYLSYSAFLSGLTGMSLEVNPDLRTEVTEQLVAGFSTMPLEQRQMLCMASLLWTVVEANWQRLNESQRGQVTQSVAAQYGNTGATNPQAAAADWNARQNMMKIMSDMNLQSHALSMNIIENVGGTGNYWEVVDKPSWMY